MDEKQVEEVKSRLESKDTEELIEIWKANDRSSYTEEVFAAIKEILADRKQQVPAQTEHIPTESEGETTDAPNKKTRSQKFGFWGSVVGFALLIYIPIQRTLVMNIVLGAALIGGGYAVGSLIGSVTEKGKTE